MVTLERGHRDIFIDRCIVRRLHSLRCRENQLGNSSHGCYQNILVLPLCCCTVSDKIYLRESYHATRETALRYTASAARAELSALSAPRSGVSLSAEHDVLYVAARAGTAWIAMFRAPVINSRMLPPCPTAVAAAAVKDAKRPRFDPFLD